MVSERKPPASVTALSATKQRTVVIFLTMPEAAAKTRAGRTPNGRRRVRGALALAALDLFAKQGYERTTVDEIAEAAGVGRRTFFRYFRSKEDVVFPDHDEKLDEVVALLEASDTANSPLVVVGEAAELVLGLYLADPEVSLKRFALTAHVPSLRDKEIATTHRYQRLFSRYLRDRLGSGLQAAVAAAAVVAAHNHVLREWLRRGGTGEPLQELRDALATMTGVLNQAWGKPGNDQLIVGVVRTDASPSAVLGHLENALRDLPGE